MHAGGPGDVVILEDGEGQISVCDQDHLEGVDLEENIHKDNLDLASSMVSESLEERPCDRIM
jgi:hypothetical protein